MNGTNDVGPLIYDDRAGQAKTDAPGRFVLTDVPPGEHRILWNVPQGDGSWMGQLLGPIDLKPGETKQVTFGEDGRTVLGKVTVGSDAPKDWQQGHFYLHTFSTLEPKIVAARTQEQRMKIIQSAQFQKEMINMHNYPAILLPDGSFKVEDVAPGKYEMTVDFFSRRPIRVPPATVTYLRSEHEFTVQKLVGTNDVPLDLGTIPLKPFTMSTFLNKTNSVTRE
jgi:hypothetical protein